MAEENRMTYEKLYELVRREKGREELQKLEPDTLPSTLAFLNELNDRIGSIDRTSMFGGEHDQLMIQLQNARRLVKDLYERRERKILDLALNRSRTGSDLVDTSSLTPEEKALFEMVLTPLDAFRRGVLNNVVQLRPPEKSLTGVSFDIPVRKEPAAVPTPETTAPAPLQALAQAAEPAPKPKLADGTLKLRFLSTVDQFVGEELELYGPFQAGDEAELPDTVASILIEQGSAVEN